MKKLLVTTMFALAAAMYICPAGEGSCRLSSQSTCKSPAIIEKLGADDVRIADGAYVCRISASVRAAEGQVLDPAKFSVRAEWKETRTPNELSRDILEWSSQVTVKLDASHLHWQKGKPDWSDGVESFEISFPIAVMGEYMEIDGSLKVDIYYDGENINNLGHLPWAGGVLEGGSALD